MRRSISRIIADRAAFSPDEVVVVDADGALTAGDLDAAATSLAHALLDAGVGHDDLVTVSLLNDRRFVVACAAVWRAGATPQPTSVRLGRDIRGAVERMARPAAVIGEPPVDSRIAWFADTAVAPDGRPLRDLVASSWKAPTTSGSTGQPKVVRSTGPALLDPEKPVAPFLPLRAVQLVTGPLTHSATFTYAFRGLLTGHRLVIAPRFDETRWVDEVEKHGITWALVVPTTMHRLLRLDPALRPRAAIASLETVVHLGAPCPPDLKRAFLEWVGPDRVVEVYAGSESNGLTMIRGDEWLRHPGSVGRGVGGTRVQIRDGSGTVLAAGETGTVWLHRGDQPAYSYVGSPSRRDAQGWDTLGDLGRLDGDGYLYLADRAADVIDRGGTTVLPTDIERVLERHPLVRSALAVALPDARMGAVVDVADADVTEADVESWVARSLGADAPDAVLLHRRPLRDDAGKANRRSWIGPILDAEAGRLVVSPAQ